MSNPINQFIGGELRRLRKRARVQAPAAWRRIRRSKATFYRIEEGAAPIEPEDVRALGEFYRAESATVERLVRMAEAAADGSSTNWWDQHGGSPSNWFAAYLALESHARHISMWAPCVIPGLLQTQAYAAAVMLGVSPEEAQRRVDIRMARQRLFDRDDPPAVDVLLGEAAIRQRVGGAEVMREQLLRLWNLSQRPNVRLRIVPFDAGAHPALGGGPIVLLNGDNLGTGLAYLEGHGGATYLSEPEAVEQHAALLEGLGASALSEGRSRELLVAVGWLGTAPLEDAPQTGG